jgi:hypothetical protein
MGIFSLLEQTTQCTEKLKIYLQRTDKTPILLVSSVWKKRHRKTIMVEGDVTILEAGIGDSFNPRNDNDDDDDDDDDDEIEDNNVATLQNIYILFHFP